VEQDTNGFPISDLCSSMHKTAQKVGVISVLREKRTEIKMGPRGNWSKGGEREARRGSGGERGGGRRRKRLNPKKERNGGRMTWVGCDRGWKGALTNMTY